MMSDKTAELNRDGKGRPFPWRCTNCKEKEVYPLPTDYTTTVKHDGNSHSILIRDLPIPTCRKCGERTFTAREEEHIIAALLAHLKLLSPEVILEKRLRLQLNQQEVAEQLGVSEKTVSQWEAGTLIQSRAMDNLLRLYFDCQEARTFLRVLLDRDEIAQSSSPLASPFPPIPSVVEGT